ncbi:unnamed protein product [Cercopithifilaria johnstoni]|uniref:Uncharacterized protein n=1 Tax=Cercopithifilaria johnstoni TaxID=2874296 RepID=A0A8J2MD68_9BILA|nr:unnamed protein product [Cercopithifilaria johnstoni]
MDDEDQIMHPVDAELLSSEEEFNYPSDDPQPSTSFFTTPNLLLNSCRHRDLFLQQFASSQIPLVTGTEIPIDSQYSETTTSLPIQSLSITSHLVPELLNSLAWDQWLSTLATSLTPAQWQLYWMNYLTLYGTIGLPQHLVNFFATAATSNFSSPNLLSSLQTNATNWMLFRQQFHGMTFLFLLAFFFCLKISLFLF